MKLTFPTPRTRRKRQIRASNAAKYAKALIRRLNKEEKS